MVEAVVVLDLMVAVMALMEEVVVEHQDMLE